MDENIQPTTETTEVVAADTPNQGMVIIELENMIKQHLTSIDTLETEYSKHRDMLEDIFNNDATYKEHAQKAKEAARIKNNTKQEIMKQPSVAELAEKVKDMKREINELQNALSDYLREFQRLSGSNEIEDDAGEVREIIYVAKLIRKSYKKES